MMLDMEGINVIELTQKLITFNTVNPPGQEAAIAEFTAELLSRHGFETDLVPFGENRLHLVAGKGIQPGTPALVLSGHFDTVPLGAAPWNTDPFTGVIRGDRLYGRGASDMKAGLAAMIGAAVNTPPDALPEGGIRLMFTAGEELGCQGAADLAKTYENPGRASAVIIGEPTGNLPAVGHKGAIYFRAVCQGKTAHSSMPEKGINAIYKAARGIVAISGMRFPAGKDELLGFPTINVGKISGGMNLNSVPDHAEFTIDVRSTKGLGHDEIIAFLAETIGPDIVLEKLVDLEPVSTPVRHPFVSTVYSVCREQGIVTDGPLALPYVTDGSVLQHLYPGAPVMILGPGEPAMAHQTDEYCDLSKIRQAEQIYQQIILKWRNT